MTGLSRRDGNENSGLDILDPDLLEDLDYDSLLSDDKLQSEIASFNGVDNLISASNLFADYNLEPDMFITGSADLLVNSAETVVFDDASAVNFVFAQEGTQYYRTYLVSSQYFYRTVLRPNLLVILD